VMDPDEVEIDVFGEGAEQRKDVDDLRGLRWEFGFVEVGRERGGRREIESERDVLADVEAGVVEMMERDVSAEGVAAFAGVGGGGESGVHVGADFGADWRGLVEIGVIAAGVEGGAHVKEGLVGFERDGGSALLDLRGAWAESGVDALLFGGGVRV